MELSVRELELIKNGLTLSAVNDDEVEELKTKISKEIEKQEKDNKDNSCGYCSGNWN